MKIVVLDGYTLNPGDISWDGLKAIGELTVYGRTAYDRSHEELIAERIGDAEVVFTNKTPLTQGILERMKNLKFIGVLATGYNVVDVGAAEKLGITVCNIPAYGTDSVGQMAIALLLELCNHVGAHSDAVKKGEWEHCIDWCFWNFPLVELSGKTAGIIGFGRIGQATGRVVNALGMHVLAYNRSKNPSLESNEIRYVELDELLQKSDVVFLHCPLSQQTEGIINRATIAKMKDGVLLINNARGPLIVEQDLADALHSGKVAGAALDVVGTEPIKSDNPLLQAKNCLITPHISWAPKETRQRLMDIAVNNLKSYLDGKAVNVVHP